MRTAEWLRRRIESAIVVAPNGCFIWCDSRTTAGYGNLTVSQRGVYAHRLAYELAHGPIPAGLHIDHICRNRACVRVEHLRAVTPAENCRRTAKAEATACVHGHPFDEANTYYRTDRFGRVCRTCMRAHKRKRAEKGGERMKCRYCHASIVEPPRRFFRGQVIDSTVCNVCRWDEAVEFSGVDAETSGGMPR